MFDSKRKNYLKKLDFYSLTPLQQRKVRRASKISAYFALSLILIPRLVMAFAPFPLQIFSMAAYDQRPDTWIPQDQPGYDQPLLDSHTQTLYHAHLLERLCGKFSPWHRSHVETILRNNLLNLEKEALLHFSNEGKPPTEIGYGMNFRPHSLEWIKKIETSIPLEAFKQVSFCAANRAITTQNLDARVLPTSDRHFYSYTVAGQGYPFDNLQMSTIFIGTPVYVVLQTHTKAWSLVLTPDCLAWVESKGLAYTHEAFIKKWSLAAHKHLGAILQTNTALVTPHKQVLSEAYVGCIFPARPHISGDLLLKVPVSNFKGRAFLTEVRVSPCQATLVPLKPSPQSFVQLLRTLQKRDYGWGGLSFYNDCSAELKNLFLPFGIWLPRHSSDQVQVAEMIDRSASSKEERLAYLKEKGHPLLTIVYIGGHVFLYVGNHQQSSGSESVAMTYQNLWGLSPPTRDSRSVIGMSVFFPLLLRYPEDSSLSSLAEKQFFQICFLNCLPQTGFKKVVPHIRHLRGLQKN